MKAKVSRLMLPVAVAGMLVSGCAAVTPGGETAKRYVVDQDYVAAVERSARGMPVEIVWVNPPRKEVQESAEVDRPQD